MIPVMHPEKSVVLYMVRPNIASLISAVWPLVVRVPRVMFPPLVILPVPVRPLVMISIN